MPKSPITSLDAAVKAYKPVIEQRSSGLIPYHYLYFKEIDEASHCLEIINTAIAAHQQIMLAMDDSKNDPYFLRVPSYLFTHLQNSPLPAIITTTPAAPLHTPVTITKPSTTNLPLLSTNARYPYPQFYIKNIVGEDYNHFQKFLISITQLPNDKHEPLRSRSGPKKRYGVKGTQIIDREQKKITGRGQYLPEEKQGFSKHQSTTYINTALKLEPELFSAYGVAEVAFMFPLDSALINRIFIYHLNGATATDPYAFNTRLEAEDFIRRSTKKGGAAYPFSFDTLKELEDELIRTKQQKALTEILARLRFQANNCAVAISKNTYSGRWLACGFANRLKQRLLYRETFYQNDTSGTYQVPKDYEVPIFYYLPSDQQLHLTAYTPKQQQLDMKEALSIYGDSIRKKLEFERLRFEFLLCIDPDHLLKEQYTYPDKYSYQTVTAPLLDYLIQVNRGHIAELIYMKASYKAQNEYARMQRKGATPLTRLLEGRFDEMLESVKHHQSKSCLLGFAQADRWQEVICIAASESINDRNIQDFQQALLLATEVNLEKAIEALINAGSLTYKPTTGKLPLIQCTRTGNTPYHWAILKSNNTLFNGAIPTNPNYLNVKNRDNLTPLDLAAMSNQWGLAEKITEWIISTKSELNAVKFQITITCAIKAQQFIIAKRIIELLEKTTPTVLKAFGIETNVNLLHIAIETNNKDLFLFLIEQSNYIKTSLLERNLNGLVPVIYAMRQNNWAFVERLIPLTYKFDPKSLHDMFEMMSKGQDCSHLTRYYQYVLNKIYMDTANEDKDSLSNTLKSYDILLNILDFKSTILSNTNSSTVSPRSIDSPFHLAIRNQNHDGLNRLLNNSYLSLLRNMKNSINDSPMVHATKIQEWEMAKRILITTPPPTTDLLMQKEYHQALYEAIKHKQSELTHNLVKIMTNWPRDFMAQSLNGENVLHLAIQQDDINLVKLLLIPPLLHAIWHSNKNDITPIELALNRQQMQIAEVLLDPALIQQTLATKPARTASKPIYAVKSEEEIIYSRLTKLIYVAATKNQNQFAQEMDIALPALITIIENSYIFPEMSIIINDSNKNISSLPSPIEQAIDAKNVQALNRLFEHQKLATVLKLTSETSFTQSTLMKAASADFWEGVKIIKKHNNQIDEPTYEFVMYHAVKSEQKDIIELLLKNEPIKAASSSNSSNQHYFFLHEAAKKPTPDIIRMFINHHHFTSTHLLSRNESDLTPLMLALSDKNYDIALELINYHKPTELQSMGIDYSWFIRWFIAEALRMGNHDTVTKIICAIPNTLEHCDYRIKDGNFLHFAIQNNSSTMIKIIMQQKNSHVFATTLNSAGNNPPTCAAQLDRWDMIEIMRSHIQAINKQNLTRNVKRDGLIDLLQAFDQLKSIVTEIENAYPKQSAPIQAIKNTLENCINETLQFKIEPEITTKHNIEQHMQTLFKQVEEIKPQLGTNIKYKLLNALAYTLAIASIVGLVALIIYAAVQRRPYVFFQAEENKIRRELEENSDYQHIQKNISLVML